MRPAPAWPLALALLGPGCFVDAGGVTGGGGSTSPAATTTAATTSSASDGDPTLTDASTTTTTTTATTTATTDPGSTGPDTTTGAGERPDGEMCGAPSDCMSGNCYALGFAGAWCGPCDEDGDCKEGGCSPPSPFKTPSVSACNDGSLGSGCRSDAACQAGLTCSPAFEIAEIFLEVLTCGACKGDADCMAGLICAPKFSVPDFNGANVCMAPGSLPQDSYCRLDNGGQACASGICSVVEIMGVAKLGACGQCESDADCNGAACVPGSFSVVDGTLLGSTCP